MNKPASIQSFVEDLEASLRRAAGITSCLIDSVADQHDDNISGALDAVYRELEEAQGLLKRRSALQEGQQS